MSQDTASIRCFGTCQASSFGTESRVLAMMADAASGSKRAASKEVVFSVPERFSIIDEPERVVQHVAMFARSAREAVSLRRVLIDHSRLRSYDLAANALLDVVAQELSQQYRFRDRRLSFKGNWPKSPEAVRFVRAIGIIKHLNVRHEAPLPDEARTLQIFDKRQSSYRWERKGKTAFRDQTVS